jgi:hypothetical protein
MKQIVVTNRGQVKRFDVPEGWSETTPSRGVGDVDYLQEFTSAENEAVKLSFYYRGTRINKVTATEFLHIQATEPHELLPAERERIGIVIRDAAETKWFDLQSIRTDVINKKKVLVVEGTWRKNRLSNLGLFLDTDGSGSAIQEIHYLAPEEDYQQFLPVAIKAIKSIEWK